jgi:hypothetical protein
MEQTHVSYFYFVFLILNFSTIKFLILEKTKVSKEPDSTQNNLKKSSNNLENHENNSESIKNNLTLVLPILQ